MESVVLTHLTIPEIRQLFRQELEQFYSKVQAAPAVIQTTEKPLSVIEAAEFLNLEPATIYGLVHKKEIPYQKPAGSKRLYFSKQELTEWLKSGRKKTTAELATDAGNYLRKGPKPKRAR